MAKNLKYKIITFGCQFNKSDTERVAAVLEKLGYKKTEKDQQADLILVLACSVRQSAIDRVYGLKRKWEKLRQKKPLITILSGCILKSDQKKMAEFFDIILPITDLAKLPKLLAQKALDLPADYLQLHPSYQSDFQAYVPVMTGCNNFCSYCVVPYVRGREGSRSAKEIIKECKKLIARGYKEITLLGQNVNSYKSKAQNPKPKTIYFPDLLRLINQIPGDYWLRFVTSHPKDLSDELIKVMAEGKHITSYLHLPVQSGDKQILKKMNRGYTVSHYKKLIKEVRKAIPGIAISTDVIVGFPSETKKQFGNTVNLFKEIKFDMAYIAQYSERPGTAAAKLKDDVPKAEKKRRDKVLTEVLEKTALDNNKKLIGKIVEVLVEGCKKDFCLGKTATFKTVKIPSIKDLTGQIALVKITGADSWGLEGELVSQKVVVILGTNASGKTKLAVKLAKKFNGEIISADSRQVYIGMDIGTGKDLKEYGKIPYHLIDIVSPKTQFSLAEYQKLAYQAIKDILKQGKVPIICGGTGLYISAIVEGYQLPEAQSSKLKAQNIRRKLNKLTLKQLLTQLKKIDPETYKVIDKKNRRRVQRALEIYYQTGLPKSAQLKKKKPPYNFLLLGVTFPKKILHQRIDRRLEHRLAKEGMIDEVKQLHQQGVSWKKLEEFGLEYRLVAKYLQGKISYDEMVEELKKAIHSFAKRQMTWFRRDKRIKWLQDYPQAEKLAKKFLRP